MADFYTGLQGYNFITALQAFFIMGDQEDDLAGSSHLL